MILNPNVVRLNHSKIIDLIKSVYLDPNDVCEINLTTDSATFILLKRDEADNRSYVEEDTGTVALVAKRFNIIRGEST
jgi:hypothetical protein